MRSIAQLRWNILMDAQEEYDCSNSTVDWSTRGIPRPYFAAFCILFAIVTIPLYVLSAVVIWTMRRGSTYKVMFVLALADILTLFVNSLTFGFFLAMGEMYCHNPKMHFVNAFVIQFGFTLSCITCLLLAINRMMELISGRAFKLIFKGSRTWFLLAVTIIYPFFLASFTPLFFFNSEYHIATVNPGIFEDRFEYYNVAHILNNTLMPTLSALVYVIMLLFVLIREHHVKNRIRDQTSVNRAAMMLSLQSGIIVSIHFTTGITYEITQYIPPTDGILYMAQFAWMLEHGLPPFIYIFFNQTVREGVRQYIAPVASSFVFVPTSIKPKSSVHPVHLPAPPSLPNAENPCSPE